MRTKIFAHATKTKYTKDYSYKQSSKHPTYFLKCLKNPIQLPAIEKLNLELYTLYKQLSPKPEELFLRKKLIKQLTEFLQEILPDFKIHTFGSSRCNTFLPNSDVDIVLMNDSKDIVPNKILRLIASKAEKASFLDQSYILHVRQARVPILKLREKNYGLEFDIVINKGNCLKQADFILNEIENRPYLKPMCILLKYFLKIRSLSDSRFGGLCSYAQFLMLLSFSQLHPIIQQNGYINPNKNLGVLFMDFFQLYGCDFPYETVTISVKDICYYKKVISNSIISLEDPVDIKHDVGDNCIQMYSIKDVFYHVYKIMAIVFKDEIKGRDSLLGLWMTLDMNQELLRIDLVEKYKKSQFIAEK